MPLVSVIVPVYNGVEFIERCYDSLNRQTLKDFEMIFVNDGSTDNSLSMLNNLKEKDERVKVLSQENKKLGSARNTGVKSALGEYISYVDVDDFISEDFLQNLYDTAKEFDADISMTSVIRYKNEKSAKTLLKYDEKKCYTDQKEKWEKSFGIGVGRSVWNKLYRRDFLIKNNLEFRENVFYEDADYTVKAVFLANKIATTNKGNYFYFVNKKSIIRCNLSNKKQEDKYIGTKTALLFELKHGLNKDFGIIVKHDYSFLKLNFLRVKEKIDKNNTYEQYLLFDCIKIFEKKYKTVVE